jgi:hypothetical protein
MALDSGGNHGLLEGPITLPSGGTQGENVDNLTDPDMMNSLVELQMHPISETTHAVDISQENPFQEDSKKKKPRNKGNQDEPNRKRKSPNSKPPTRSV